MILYVLARAVMMLSMGMASFFMFRAIKVDDPVMGVVAGFVFGVTASVVISWDARVRQWRRRR